MPLYELWPARRDYIGALETKYDERDTVGELWAFENEVYDALMDYCEDHDYYPLNCVLAIDPITPDVLIDTLDNVDDCDIYPIGFFLDGDEPDTEEIRELALKYFNVD